MFARIRPRLTYANVISTVCLFMLLGGGAYAATSLVGANGKIHGCVSKKGQLTVVKTGKKCDKGSTAIAWNQKGPKGDTGPAGPGVKQYEFNAIPADGQTYPMAPPVAGIQVKARCDASKLYVIVDTVGGQTMHLSGIVQNDNNLFGDNPVGSVTSPSEFFATAYGGFDGIAESSESSKWVGLSVWGGHRTDSCRFWGTITPPE